MSAGCEFRLCISHVCYLYKSVCLQVLIQLVDDDPATQHAVSAAEGLQAALSLLRKRDAAAETVARAAALVRKLCGGNAANQVLQGSSLSSGLLWCCACARVHVSACHGYPLRQQH